MISKSPINKESLKKNVVATASARAGWKLILETLPKDAEILLPSYIGVTDREGSGIYDPVTDLGVRHDFYPLNQDLSISIPEIKSKIREKNYSLILVVHYFGFKVRNIKNIKKLCEDSNIILVEDCAHLYNYNMLWASDAGSFGDYAFYSLHKNFPIKSGGLLVQNNKNHNKIISSSKDKNSVYFETLMKYQVEAIAQKRIENFKFLEAQISNVSGVKPFKKLQKGDIPHNYPIIVDNHLREKLYFSLIDKGIMLIALYYRLIEPLKISKFESMQFLANNILNLPVHQDIDQNEIVILVNMIKKSLKELNS
ncbi:DegT/DnrJ/EryC1/StrS family aminotransferase [Hyunsoonleella sp. SJ7]|uniref:DegT/DnrJ/EryC1/StrS family aminotransferase n=1 Tax=Hyunsoonleella aquatilis TaxID=2762758 RepID=A0A923KKE1_9FLAO|nr:DegT/DnrJ/EryC1/StrS family aminotransferase [Hyunsoonleella aquatilis]MBC3757748.1 DegT/DnrJ/EryC1/StrS family aminotransferase [Hyunsoonleella aquatilis]